MENNTTVSENNSDAQKQFTPSKEKNTGMAVVAYILFFVPLLTDAKDDPFVKFHVKQGLLVFIAYVATSMLSFILFPLLFLVYLLQIGITILAILGIVNALHGKEEQLPLIGKFADTFTF
jgi:uncharacterized membrane protein